jgi:hypothetical protein
VLALVGIAVVTLLLIAAWRFGGPDETPVHGVNTNPRRAVAPVASGLARLELRATKGNSYLIVRSRSAIGKVLYQGTLERGQKQRFDGQVLWLRLETPGNVLAKVNGNRVKLGAAVKAQGVFVTAKKVFAADAT